VQPTSTPTVAAPTPSAAAPASPPRPPSRDTGPPAGASAPQAAPVRRASSPPAMAALAADTAADTAETHKGASPSTGGIRARAARVVPAGASSPKRSSRRAHRRAAAPVHRSGLALRPAASTPPLPELSRTAGGPASLVRALGPLAASAPLTGAAGTDARETLLVLLGGALLIALMCLDAVGVGPRHDYLRRQVTRHRWRPWR
jgi:hypothetical protein